MQSNGCKYSLSGYNKLLGVVKPTHVLGFWDIANAERTYVTLQHDPKHMPSGILGVVGNWFYTPVDDWKPDLSYFGCWEMSYKYIPLPSYAYQIVRKFATAMENSLMNSQIIVAAIETPQVIEVGHVQDPKLGPVWYYLWASTWRKAATPCEIKGVPKFFISMSTFEIHPTQYRFMDRICDANTRKQWMYIGPGRSHHMAKLLNLLADCLEWIHCSADGNVIPNWDKMTEWISSIRPSYEPEIWDRRHAFARGNKDDEFFTVESIYGSTYEHMQFDKLKVPYIAEVNSWIDDQ